MSPSSTWLFLLKSVRDGERPSRCLAPRSTVVQADQVLAQCHSEQTFCGNTSGRGEQGAFHGFARELWAVGRESQPVVVSEGERALKMYVVERGLVAMIGGTQSSLLSFRSKEGLSIYL